MFTFKQLSGLRTVCTIIAAVAFSACISNDLPYPWVMPNVDSFEVMSLDSEGHDLISGPVEIDSINSTITINLTEWADIKNVKVTDVEFSDGTICLEPEIFESPLNLTSPVEFKLQRYDHIRTWTILATQTIERYFTVASQIGTAVIDTDNHTAKALVPTGQPLDNITVRTLKLAGPSAIMTPNLIGQRADFTQPVKITVSEYGQETVWTLSIEQTDVSVEIEHVDAWSNVAWVYANAEEGKANGFEYRRADAGDNDWIAAPDEWITHNGGSFTLRLIHLDSQKTYLVRATSDDAHSAEVEFTTEATYQLPNSDFSQWWLDGKVWCPWSQDGESFWSTGNKGAATLGNSNTVPLESDDSSTGYSGAVLETKFVGISILGKIASGNLFTGEYVKTVGTNGILAFGRPFTARPTKLKAHIKYTTAPITDASKSNPNFQYMIGQPDTCIVWCSLGDWNEPYEIRTSPSDRQLFSRTDPGVIAYGQYQSGESINDYVDIEIPLEYNATDRTPKYILVTASASKYGDYFTGGRGAVLYIDSYELIYDY